MWPQALYGGDPLYAGHADMYWAVRNVSQALVIIGGTGWAQDAAGLLAINEQFKSQYKTPMAGVVWNLHPYQVRAQAASPRVACVCAFSGAAPHCPLSCSR